MKRPLRKMAKFTPDRVVSHIETVELIALGLQEAETPGISRLSVREGGKVVSPTHRPPFYLPGDIPGTHSC